MSKGYQHSPAYDEGFLPVGSIHKLHYEQYGKKDGKPVVFLHGGPGGGTYFWNTSFFNPNVYRVILFDQRGCGKSLPHADIRENTTQHLVSDLEALREHLGIKKWFMVFGGSWGSTLALAYAQAHPDGVSSLVVRGIFTVRKLELDYTFSPQGAAMLFPDGYQKLLNFLPPEDRANPAPAFHKMLCSEDPEVRRPAAKAWNAWEISLSHVDPPQDAINQVEDDAWSLAHSRMEAHYFVNNAFLEEGQLLKAENIARIKHIPCSIIQGRFDFVCPARTAWDLHQALPDSKLYMIKGAGHNAKEPGVYDKLLEVCDEYASKDF